MDFSNLLEALQNPEIYPEKPEKVELLQTQVSAIFIVGEHVYKVKKPVNFGFLDFTTLEKRKYFCRKEVVLNRRLCPEVYLGVAEIRLQNGRITLGEGAGEIIEYAVLMKKLPQDCLMDRRLAESKVTPQDLARKTGADFLLIECRCEDAILPRRLSGRLGKANDPSAGRWELFQEQKKIFEKIQGWEPDLYLPLNTRFPLEECLQRIFRHLLKRGARADEKEKKEVGR